MLKWNPQNSCKDRFNKQTFYARVLSLKNIFIEKVEIDKENTTDERMEFFLYYNREANKPIPAGTEIKYIWAYSCPIAYLKKEPYKFDIVTAKANTMFVVKWVPQ